MKTRLLLIALVLLPLAVFAQTSAVRLRPVEPAAPVTTVAPAPAAQAELAVDPRVVDPQGTIDRLEANNRELSAENARLQDNVASLDARIAAMTTRGGSEVRAYCETPNESRNTAGAAQACGNFSCNDVSGLCHERCTTSDQCAIGRCDVRYGVCSERPID
jgi:hypothetical protein